MKISKLFFAFMTLSLLFAFSGCSSDDDDDNSIVGTWTFSKAIMSEVKTNSSENDAKIKAYFEKVLNADLKGQKMTFTEDGKVSVSSLESGSSSNGTYTLNGGILTITYNYGDDGESIVKNEVAVEKNNLNISLNYLEEIEYLTSADLNSIGITDPDFKATKAMMKTTFVR